MQSPLTELGPSSIRTNLAIAQGAEVLTHAMPAATNNIVEFFVCPCGRVLFENDNTFDDYHPIIQFTFLFLSSDSSNLDSSGTSSPSNWKFNLH